MINQEGATPVQAKRTYVGPLAPYIDGFVLFLLREGYSPVSVNEKRYVITDLSRWMERRKLPLARLNEEQLTHFRISRQRRGRQQRGAMWAADQLLRYLRDLGCISLPRKKIDRTALGQLIQDFERYLSAERGLSRSTLVDYPLIARRFLSDRFGNNSVRVKALRPRDIHRFIIRHLKAGSRGQAKRVVSALRSFLRFLHQRNKITINLATAVPGVADWRFSHLPRSLPQNQVKQLLASCDRTTPVGRRDYAILLLMARLGLRAGEIAKMTLDDLDWARGEIVVHGKGQREARLPLPTDVGTALVSYLRFARPECSTRLVFIRTRAPRRGLKAASLGLVVRSALKRAGLNPVCKGSHVLRHSLATNLQRRGATLTEIGQLLRHNDLTTTQIYAKVDIGALRTIALPWPRGAQ
jgi:site-specific recombinase XerD